MSESFTSIPITDRVHWVGAIDWDIRDFHGYSTSRGTTYNAFLILADKVTLIDTVKAPFREELLSRIRSVIDPSRIQYIVSNHAEMDHSGCLPEMIDIIQPEKVFASAMGVKALAAHFNRDLNLETVKDGDRIDLGNCHLSFMETRMLHWPDSMFSFLEEDQLLFSQDAFGMHLATSERFDDEIDDWILHFEAAKYYANILLPFSNLIQKLVAKIATTGWKFKMILPDHGPVWRSDLDRIINWYAGWAEQKPTRKAVVAYDTMWGSTELMARAISEGLLEGGSQSKLMPLSASHRSDVATEILDAGALIIGSPTINANMYPTIADLLSYLRGLKPKNMTAAAFGSYGWSCQAVPQIESILTDMGLELPMDPVKVVYVPNNEDLEKCRELGRQVAAKLRTMTE